ncbi:hypothetical protein SD208_18840 [Ochrobactrum sp. BD67]
MNSFNIPVSLTNAHRLGRPAAAALAKSTWAPDKLAVDGKAVFSKAQPKSALSFQTSPEKGPALSGSHRQCVDENYQRKDKAAKTHCF